MHVGRRVAIVARGHGEIGTRSAGVPALDNDLVGAVQLGGGLVQAALEEEHPQRAIVVSTVIIVPGATDQVGVAVIVEITYVDDRAAEEVSAVEGSAEAPFIGADLARRVNVSVAVQGHYPEGALRIGALGCDGDFGPGVPIDIPDGPHAGAETIVIGQETAETNGTRADLVFTIDLAIDPQEKHPHSASIRSTIIIATGSDHEVLASVAVEVSDARHAATELVVGFQSPLEGSLGSVDALRCANASVGVQRDGPYRPRVLPEGVVARHSDSDVRTAVIVEVSESRDRGAERIAALQIREECVFGDLVRARDAAVIHEKENPDRARVRAPVIVARGAHEQIDSAVSVQIPDGIDVRSESIACVQRSADCSGSDRLLRFQRTIRIEKEHPHAALRPLIRSPHGEVLDPVPIQVAERSHTRTKPRSRARGASETPYGLGDLGLRVHETRAEAVPCVEIIRKGPRPLGEGQLARREQGGGDPEPERCGFEGIQAGIPEERQG